MHGPMNVKHFIHWSHFFS